MNKKKWSSQEEQKEAARLKKYCKEVQQRVYKRKSDKFTIHNDANGAIQSAKSGLWAKPRNKSTTNDTGGDPLNLTEVYKHHHKQQMAHKNWRQQKLEQGAESLQMT